MQEKAAMKDLPFADIRSRCRGPYRYGSVFAHGPSHIRVSAALPPRADAAETGNLRT